MSRYVDRVMEDVIAKNPGEPEFYQAVLVTMRRAVVGFALAIAVGLVVGALVSRIRPLPGSTSTGSNTSLEETGTTFVRPFKECRFTVGRT